MQYLSCVHSISTLYPAVIHTYKVQKHRHFNLFASLRYRYYNEMILADEMMFYETGFDPTLVNTNSNECEDLTPQWEPGTGTDPECDLVIMIMIDFNVGNLVQYSVLLFEH